MVGPVDAARLQIFPHRLEWPQEFPLLDCESTNGEANGRAFLQQQQGFEQRERIFAARNANCDAIAIANHAEARDRLAHFAEYRFLVVHCSKVT